MLEGADYVPPKEENKPTIQFFPEYGVHKSGDITIVSSPTWEQAAKMIEENEFTGLVLLPELITTASDTTPDYTKESVEQALQSTLELSKQNPGATFVVGSPDYEGSENPYNAAFIIKDGKSIATAHKKIPAAEESYRMDTTSLPVTIGDTGDTTIAICKDALGVGLPSDPREKEFMLKFATNNDIEATQALASASFVTSDTRRVLIPACWGMAIHPSVTPTAIDTQEKINAYHQRNLQFAVEQIFQNNPAIQEVIVADRAPISQNPLQDRVTTKPLSLIARR